MLVQFSTLKTCTRKTKVLTLFKQNKTLLVILVKRQPRLCFNFLYKLSQNPGFLMLFLIWMLIDWGGSKATCLWPLGFCFFPCTVSTLETSNVYKTANITYMNSHANLSLTTSRWEWNVSLSEDTLQWKRVRIVFNPHLARLLTHALQDVNTICRTLSKGGWFL